VYLLVLGKNRREVERTLLLNLIGVNQKNYGIATGKITLRGNQRDALQSRAW
jgi:hypothetical protein